MNALNVIYPYKYEGFWVFDEDRAGLIQEPFVSGADEIVECMAHDIPNADKGFRLIFSSTPFPEYMCVFEWRREDLGGNWYFIDSLNMEGWLCPALFKYFEEAPKKIYAKFESKDRTTK